MEELKLVIKKIPNKMTEAEIKEILSLCVKGEYFNFQYVKPSHKYDDKYNNICFLSVKNLEARIKLSEFFETYEIITKKGMKHKLFLDTCVIQQRQEEPNIDDSKINNTYLELSHFQKFKEAFESESKSLLEFKEQKLLSKILIQLFDKTLMIRL